MTIPKPRARVAYFIIAFISLAFGTAFYPLVRGPNLLIWNIVPKPVFWGRRQIQYPKEGVASVLAGSGPDFFWMLSGICLLRGLWYHKRKTQRLYLALFYLVAAGYNLGQYFGLIPGTFDLLDLLFMSGVALAEAIVFNFFVGGELK